MPIHKIETSDDKIKVFYFKGMGWCIGRVNGTVLDDVAMLSLQATQFEVAIGDQ